MAGSGPGGVELNGHSGPSDEEEVHLMTEEELEKGKMRPPDIDQDMKVRLRNLN